MQYLITLLICEFYYKKPPMLGEKDEDTHEDFELPFFDRATILKATKNFSLDNKLGEGGFGSVYKVNLQNFYKYR
jgi:hypothetical protein